MKNILVALEMQHGDDLLVQKAEEIALKFGSKIWLLHVAAPDPDYVGFDAGPAYIRKTLADDLRAEHKGIRKFAEELHEKNISAEGLLVQGPTVATIFNEAQKLECDLLVLGTHKHGFLQRIFGDDVAKQIIDKTSVPLLILPLGSYTT